MQLCLGNITWQTVAAIATFAAVIVALIPILREARRRKAQARSLRIRLCSNLSGFRPSLGKVMQGGHARYAAAVLKKDEFREAVRSLGALMQESSVLQPEEQDRLGQVLVNLELTAPLYDTTAFAPETAKNILNMIDQAITVMEKYGLLHGHIENPGENQV